MTFDLRGFLGYESLHTPPLSIGAKVQAAIDTLRNISSDEISRESAFHTLQALWHNSSERSQLNKTEQAEICCVFAANYNLPLLSDDKREAFARKCIELCNEVEVGDRQYGFFQSLRRQALEVLTVLRDGLDVEQQAEGTWMEREMRQQHYKDEEERVYGPMEDDEHVRTNYGPDPDDDE